MNIPFSFLLVAVIALLSWAAWRRSFVTRRQHVINSYRFPESIKLKVKERYPELTPAQIELVMSGLRDYFHICNLARDRMVAMPSQVVDVAWHEFILFTRRYEEFCRQALGRFLHHTPAEAMAAPTVAQHGLRRAWRIACFREGIDSKKPHKLPLLFGLDARLAIPGGFVYTLDCLATGAQGAAQGQCATHIGCTSGCSGDSGSSDGGGDSGCGGGCGGD